MGPVEVLAEARHRAPLVARAAAALLDAWVAEVIAAGHGALEDPSDRPEAGQALSPADAPGVR